MYVKGTHNVICDRTGFKVKRDKCKYEWNGLLVREEDWEERQPQDFVRGVPDDKPVEDLRPETEDVFVGLYGQPVTIEDL